MSESQFDPYHVLLGISPEKQPPNHYELLGIPLFEDSETVIETAANRQMLHLQCYESGEHGDQVTQLMNEVSNARRCLLVGSTKSEYDGGRVGSEEWGQTRFSVYKALGRVGSETLSKPVKS